MGISTNDSLLASKEVDQDGHPAEVIFPGSQLSPAIELRVSDDGSSEAFLTIVGSSPRPTGVLLFRDGDRFKLQCRIRKKVLRATPEEIIRQMVVNELIDKLGYPETNINVEVPIQMGSTVHPKPADIVVFTAADKDRHWITVEVKKPNRKDGLEQLKSYMNPTGSVFGYWTNGADELHLLRSDPNDFSKPIWRLPRYGETLSDLDEPLTRSKLSPVTDLYAIFKDLEQEILAHQTVDTFNEIFKVVFAKLYDERTNLYNDDAVAKFKIGVSEDVSIAIRRVHELFEKAKAKWRDVYGPGDEILLSNANLLHCLRALQKYYLVKSGDVLGVAFELLVNQEMKGEMGQYFTPRQVVDMMNEMLNPTADESVCDPACGSGGFLIYAMRHVNRFIDSRWDDADDRAEHRKDYAQEKLIGMDNDPRLVRVAKAYMIMENDGRGGIQAVDSLDYGAWNASLRQAILRRAADVSDGSTVLTDARLNSDGVDIVLTNPPFAGAIKSVSTLRQYDLAHNKAGSLKNKVVRAILFLERCIDILKPGGRLGIVLPQGILNNFNDQYIRDFVDQKARILAVIGLHPDTFKPFTIAKTSVLFLQKWGVDEEKPSDYRIYTAVSMRPGKNKLGRPLYLDDGLTLDCDMPEIVKEFRRFAQDEQLSFAP